MTTTVAPPEQTPGWETTKEGRIFLDGVDVTDLPEFAQVETPEDEPKKETPPADADNATVEGEETAPKETPPAPEAKPKEEPEKAPEKPPEPPTEPPKAPEKFKFKTKLRGVEEEREYTPEQIQANLNRLRMYDENQKDFWAQKQKVEPYAHIVESDWFKGKIKEAYESGELTPPEGPPAPTPAIQYEVMKRQADPDYGSIVQEMRDFAMTLPPGAYELLNSDPSVFLPEYDRIAKERRDRAAAPPKEPEKKEPPPKPETVRQLLAAKEVAKEKADVGKPGVAGEPPDEKKVWKARKRELESAMRDPRNGHRNLELTAALLLHLEQEPK